MSAWVQYHSKGVMILGRFNGVDEGITIIWLCALFRPPWDSSSGGPN